MKPARLDALIWTLVYGGAIVLVLGVFLLRQFGAEGRPLATVAFAIGGPALVAGVVLLFVRARLRAAARRP